MALTNKYTLICDDVRQENTGKLIVIGIYAGVVGVPQIPATFPTGLTFFQGWESDRPGKIDLKIKIQHLESGQIIIEARAGMMVVDPRAPMYPSDQPRLVSRRGPASRCEESYL